MKHNLWIAVLLGCSSSTTTFEENAEGTTGGPCYPNNSCNPGLTCVASVCAGASADSGTSTDSATSDSGVSDSNTDDTGAVVVDAPADTTTTDAPAAGPYTKSTFAAACEDIPDTAEIASANGDDVSSDRIALPFAFKFFGDAVTQYSMASNGFLQLWNSSSGGVGKRPDNVAIPTADDPNGIVAPFWDDLVPMFSNARAGVRGTAPTRRLVVSWGHWTIKGEMSSRVTFQAKLFETTNVIEFHYCAMSPEGNARVTGSSATIGLENLAGTKGVQHSFNTAAAVATGTALRYTP